MTDATPQFVEPEPAPAEPEKPVAESAAAPAEAEPPSADEWKRTLAALTKANKEAEKHRLKIKEFEDRDKTELERAAEASKAAEQERDAAKAESLRLRTAIRHGISDEDAELFLTGTDEETLTRQAERLADRTAAAGSKTPKPDPSQGARGPVGMDARIAEAEKNGDFKTAIALKSQQLLKK